MIPTRFPFAAIPLPDKASPAISFPVNDSAPLPPKVSPFPTEVARLPATPSPIPAATEVLMNFRRSNDPFIICSILDEKFTGTYPNINIKSYKKIFLKEISKTPSQEIHPAENSKNF
jgi:hypothetical protein